MMWSELNHKTVLITGGTGYFGRKFVSLLTKQYLGVKKVIIYSRNELKQYEMEQEFPVQEYPFLEYVLGDVRDADHLLHICEGVDIIIHAAALKQVSTAEVNPSECIKTNIIGSQNVITAAIAQGVQKLVAISTDKAVAPISVYGASKLCADKLFIDVNRSNELNKPTTFVVRYGNVMGSHASVIPHFLSKKNQNKPIPITHLDATRFAITAQDAMNLVLFALKHAQGGEIFIPKIPSFRVLDLAKAICPDCKYEVIGLRPGEKIHEEMLTASDALHTIETDKYFITLPHYKMGQKQAYLSKYNGRLLTEKEVYCSEKNTHWLSVDELKKLVDELTD
ncbi:MAG: UDP-N-acetylglucosamine 4,6-dehydratase (inverting) [Bacteroidia bacterium]|nr:UDP-N-acetylglucosamine 4,6-dehydratase (inverting) [Bacteroidia bacterium]MDW8347011.1 UDP-N-acetylglucosamine 4,6-dehydratase (inverting) [Bacteroidia bacterium]